MQPKISIVVPVYNAFAFLERCLTSIVQQSFHDWECLIVDDGSTDGSSNVCDSFGNKDSRFTVFHKKNGGVSSARNVGIEHAIGQWILFVDADDVLYNDSLETLFALTEENVDSIIGDYVTIDEKGRETSKCGDIIKENIDWQALPLHFYYPFHGKYYGYLWNRLMRLDVIKKHDIRFRNDIHIKEDGLFGVEFVCKSKKSGIFYSKPVYKYTDNSNGAMRSLESKYDPKYLTDLDACICIYETIKNSGCKNFKTLLFARMYVCTMFNNVVSYMHEYDKDKGCIVKEMRKKTIDSVSYPFFLFMQLKNMIKRFLKK